MFKAEINRYEDSYRVLSSDNKSLFKGTSQECDDYIKGKTMKVIKVIQVGNELAFNMQISEHVSAIFYVTSEGISTHSNEEHMNACLNGRGFSGCLDIGVKALPSSSLLLKSDISDEDKQYIQHMVDKW